MPPKKAVGAAGVAKRGGAIAKKAAAGAKKAAGARAKRGAPVGKKAGGAPPIVAGPGAIVGPLPMGLGGPPPPMGGVIPGLPPGFPLPIAPGAALAPGPFPFPPIPPAGIGIGVVPPLALPPGTESIMEASPGSSTDHQERSGKGVSADGPWIVTHMTTAGEQLLTLEPGHVIEIATHDGAGVPDGTALFVIEKVASVDGSGVTLDVIYGGASNPTAGVSMAMLWPDGYPPYGALHMCRCQASSCRHQVPNKAGVHFDTARMRDPETCTEIWARRGVLTRHVSKDEHTPARGAVFTPAEDSPDKEILDLQRQIAEVNERIKASNSRTPAQELGLIASKPRGKRKCEVSSDSDDESGFHGGSRPVGDVPLEEMAARAPCHLPEVATMMLDKLMGAGLTESLDPSHLPEEEGLGLLTTQLQTLKPPNLGVSQDNDTTPSEGRSPSEGRRLGQDRKGLSPAPPQWPPPMRLRMLRNHPPQTEAARGAPRSWMEKSHRTIRPSTAPKGSRLNTIPSPQAMAPGAASKSRGAPPILPRRRRRRRRRKGRTRFRNRRVKPREMTL